MDSARRIHAAGDRGIARAPRRRRLGLTLAHLAFVAGCSGISANEDGIASLEIRFPTNSFVEAGTTVRLSAVARSGDGDSVDAAIRWRTPDTTITIDSLTGLVTPRFPSGSARIQAGVFGRDTIVSTIAGLTLTLTEKADSITLLTGDSLDVLQDTATATIRTRFVRGTPVVGVATRPAALRIIEPAPADSPAVRFLSGRVADSVMSDGAGGTSSQLRALRGRTPPDRVVVEVTAHRASGEAIPGSAKRIVIRYRHQ